MIWTNVTVKLAALKPWAHNPKTISKANAKRLLKLWNAIGQFQNIAIGPDGEVYDGHQRLSVLLAAYGPEYEIDARQSERALTEEERAELVIAAHVGTVGQFNWDQLAGWDVATLQDWGMDADTLRTWSADAAALGAMLEANTEQAGDADAEPQIDRAAELNEKWQVKMGDLWRIGAHRLLCGDSTRREDVERVMGGERAALCFTSPPYAEQRKEQYGGVSEDDYWEWFRTVQSLIKDVLSFDGNFVLNIKPNAKEYQRSLYVFDLVTSMVRQENWLFVDEFCWLRTGIPQQVVNRFKNAFEPCYWLALSSSFEWYPESVRHESDSVPLALGKGAGDTNAARRQGKGGGAIQGNKIQNGMAYPSNVLNFRQNAEALGHPAAFPVELPTFFVKAMSAVNNCVYEPFAGSGTTLVACQNLQRKCRAIEISPNYCAVILERMAAAFPGIEIERIE